MFGCQSKGSPVVPKLERQCVGRVDRCWTCGARCTPSQGRRRPSAWRPCAGSTWAPTPPPPPNSTPSTQSCSTTPCAHMQRSPIAPSNALITYLICLYDGFLLILISQPYRQVNFDQCARKYKHTYIKPVLI